MRRETKLARLLRAVSGPTQEQLAADLGVAQSLIAQIELGEVVPSTATLHAMAGRAGITLAEAEVLLRLYEACRRASRRRGRSADDLLEGLADDVRTRAHAAYRRLLTLPLPDQTPRAEEREEATTLFGRLEALPPDARQAVVQVAEAYQTWGLCERCCHASERAASRDLQESASWSLLAVDVAGRVRGPKAWLRRIQAYAAAFAANVLRVLGELRAADAAFAEARRLWQSGSDPAGLLDAGRMLDLEASLRRAQRRFVEALALLDEAAAVGRAPARALIKKAFTLEVMGEYERAVEALEQAEPLVSREADTHLWNLRRLNLATCLCNLGRFAEALQLVAEARALTAELGDEIDAVRITWLEGRIAAGLGRRDEALRRLGQARRQLEERRMFYDVALAVLEEATLLLEDGRTGEVEALAEELPRVFAAKGVHREALVALRLFQEAVRREEATAELARRVLRFLFRAQHDPELRFEAG